MRNEVASFTLPKLPEEDKAVVYMVRPSGLGGLVRFNVFVDDQEAPVSRKIHSKAENWAERVVVAKAGDIIFIEQEPGMGIIMARNSLKSIDEVTGKYHVKTLTLGTLIKADK